MKSAKLVRLNKYIASSGITSRRKADWLIHAGEVRINGSLVAEPGVQVDPRKDIVVVQGKTIKPTPDNVYVMFNKPPFVVTTMNDPEGRPNVGEYFTKAKVRLFPVGRLDWNSEGLLLLTNDGDFAQKVSHPRFKVAKTYLVKVDGEPTDEQLQKLVKGFSIIGGRAQALSARRMQSRGSDKYAWIQIIIDEGRNRQIRLMLEKLGYDVKKLQRTAIGSLRLSNLEKGKFKILTDDDLKKIFMLPKELREKSERSTKSNAGPRRRPKRGDGPSKKQRDYQKAARSKRDHGG